MNKNIIFYFTGTGNTQHIAREIAQKQKNTILVPLAHNLDYSINDEYDSIGIIYPTYYAGIPNIVRSFITSVSINVLPKYLFVLSNSGGINGNSVSMATELLFKRGIKTNYSNNIKNFSNYSIMADISTDAINKPNKYNSGINMVVSDIISRTINKSKRNNPLFTLWNKLLNKNTSIKDNNFSINNKCIKCKQCINVCPVNNIDEKLNFKNNCQQCLACLNACPKHAINYKNITQNRRRYLNKNIKQNELNNYESY